MKLKGVDHIPDSVVGNNKKVGGIQTGKDGWVEPKVPAARSSANKGGLGACFSRKFLRFYVL